MRSALPRLLCSLSLAFLATFMIAPSAIAVTIALGNWSVVQAYTQANGNTYDQQDYYPTTLPDSGSLTSTDSPSSSTTNYDLSDAGFLFTFDHHRGSEYGASADSNAYIYFTPSGNVDYLLSGAYAAQDDDGRHISLYTQIYDMTTNSVIHHTFQESASTSNESFTIGGSGGDTTNVNNGSPAGTLTGGHNYLLYFDAFIDAYPTESSVEADASGYVTLAFVPEPGTGLLVIAGLLGLTTQRRRTSRARPR